MSSAKYPVNDPAIASALRRFKVLGLPIHLSDHYLDWLVRQLQHRIGCHVVTLNAEMAMQAEKSSELSAVIQKAELVIPDGSGVVLYLRLYGHVIQRCPGIELAEKLLEQLSLLQGSVFLYGGSPGIAEQAAALWQRQLPGLSIAGIQHGYLSPDDRPRLRQTLQDLQPNLILVGLGVPRQEFWIAEHRQLCPQAIWVGVGGSFDIWAGVKDRAPAWLRNNHLEWVYRLYKEPWRWRRMLALPKFALRGLAERLFHKNREQSSS
jgi:N-acetylglucosaminyldiphosphoundecaprenol N-acetyl-beta-D-mannosaminyltransferase